MESSVEIRLDGKVAIVTGGSRGIGAAIVRVFAACGARVAFGYRNAAEAANAVVASATGGPDQVLAVRGDVSRMRDARRLIDAALGRFEHIDIVVLNAGIWPPDPLPIEQMKESDWDQMMAINMKGAFSVVREAVPHLIAQKSGRIILISSTAGQRGEAFHSHYGASKGGLISFAKGVAAELAPHHILVNCVAPGWVDTDMSRPVFNDRREAKRINSGIPLGRPGTADEIALPVLFLASEMASYMTGEVLNVNGGSVLCG